MVFTPNRLRSSSPHPQAEQQLGALGAKELAQARQPGDEVGENIMITLWWLFMIILVIKSQMYGYNL